MPEPNPDARISEIAIGLQELSGLLEPDDFRDLIGAIAVEIDTGMEMVLERCLSRRPNANVVAFPGKTVRPTK